MYTQEKNKELVNNVQKILEETEHLLHPLNQEEINHLELMLSVNQLYMAKNRDYGDSYYEMFKKFGLTSACIRLTDKLNRLNSFATKSDMNVKDESIDDTLTDLANYALMTVLTRKRLKREENGCVVKEPMKTSDIEQAFTAREEVVLLNLISEDKELNGTFVGNNLIEKIKRFAINEIEKGE